VTVQQVSTDFLDSLRGPHQMTARVDAVRNGTVIASDLELSAGSVTVDSTSNTRAQLSATFPDRRLIDVLSTAGVELRVQAGVRFYGGSEMVPLGMFPVGKWDMGYSLSGGVQVTAPDRWTVVQRTRFLTPVQWADRWGSVSDAVGDLMLDPWRDRLYTNPATVVPSFRNLLPDKGTAQPALVWKQDRDKAVQDLVTSLGAEAFFNEVGNVVLRARPTLSDTPVWDADASQTGVLMGASRSRSWEQVYNTVIVQGLSPADSSTVTARGMAQVNNSNHPLWVDGPFGEVPYFYSSTLITTDEQAQEAAASLLMTAASFNSILSATCVPNPALQAGDTIRVTLPTGEQELHVLEGFNVPLTLDSYTQNLSLRSSKETLPQEGGDSGSVPTPTPGPTPPTPIPGSGTYRFTYPSAY
jgi:hypothetical protein